MNAEDKVTIKLIKKHLQKDAKEYSYQKLLQFGFYGFIEYSQPLSKVSIGSHIDARFSATTLDLAHRRSI